MSSPSTPPRAGLLPLVATDLQLAVAGTVLVDHFTATVDGAGITVVMGPNGAGKSLLLRLLHGLIQPTKGSVTWAGLSLDETVRSRQAMVFQRPVLLRRSVRDNMTFVLPRRAGRSVDRCCRMLLERVGLACAADKPARRLSGGEQQRLALARALALEPEVLFMDEATASLDPASTAMIESVVRDLSESGVKVMFVTHDVGQARRLADEVIFLHHGRLCEHTPARAFFERPASLPARQYLAGEIVT
jgi:tungstate transport system ATP-binding protein